MDIMLYLRPWRHLKKNIIIDRILIWGSPALNSGDWPGNAWESLRPKPRGGAPVSA
jgi:hypothetical protein